MSAPPQPLPSAAAGAYTFWGLTAVVYERGSPLSLFLGIVSLAPVLIILVVLLLGILAPSRRVAVFSLGMGVNFAISYYLKQKVFRQPRPEHPWPLANRADFGMPSNHSQFMSYFLAALFFTAVDYAKERRWMRSAVGKTMLEKEEAAARQEAERQKNAEKDKDSEKEKEEKAKKDAAKNPAAAALGPLASPLAITMKPSRSVRYQTMQQFKARSLGEVFVHGHGRRLSYALALTMLVMLSRVHGNFHTVGQVWAGFGLGLVVAFVLYRIKPFVLALEIAAENTFLELYTMGHELLVETPKE